MRSSYLVRQISNKFFLVTSGKFSLITFSKYSCLLGDKLKEYEIAFIASIAFLKPITLEREFKTRVQSQVVILQPNPQKTTYFPCYTSRPITSLTSTVHKFKSKSWQCICHCVKQIPISYTLITVNKFKTFFSYIINAISKSQTER